MASPASTSLTEAEKKRNSSAMQLLDATASLLCERSASDVSFSDIAKRSGLNSALIKYYFGNKEGLLLALIERDATLHIGALRHLVAKDIPADQKLKIHIGGIIDAYHNSPYLNRLIYHIVETGQPSSGQRVAEVFIKPMVDAYEAIISQGVQEGVFRPVEPALLYYSLVGSCDHIFHAAYSVEHVLHEARISDDLRRRYIAHVAEIVLRGLAP